MQTIDNSKVYDIAIAGGGPSGSTMATLLARKGYKVIVFERDKFPRDHVGESLLPFCNGLFRDLGLYEKMEKMFVRKPGVQFISPDGKDKTTYCFSHFIKDKADYLSFHVMRGPFDKMLLEHSESHGAEVFQQTKVVDVELDGPDGLAHVKVMQRGTTSAVEVRARQFIDASGQVTFLAKKMGTRKPFDNLDRVAYSTHWAMKDMPAGLGQGELKIVYLGGEKLGWVFVIPVAVNRVSIGVVLNAPYVKKRKQELMDAGVKDWQKAIYTEEINESPFVSKILPHTSHQLLPLMINGDYSYFTTESYGKNWVIVGDAKAFLDPIFASGIYLSMKTCFMVAEAVDAKLKSGDLSDNRGMEKAFETVQGAYSLVGRFIDIFYNPKAMSFAGFKSLDSQEEKHQRHESAFALAHYLIAGDFFTNNRKYHEFLDLIEDPKNYDRFKATVMSKEDASQESCNINQDVIFGELVKEMEKMAMPVA